MKALAEMSAVEIKLAIRSFYIAFLAFVAPPLMLLLIGGMQGNAPKEIYGGFGAVDILVPSFLGMVLSVMGLLSFPLQLGSYRQHKVLKRFKATPISTGTIMAPHFIVNALFGVIGAVVLIVVGMLAFKIQFYGNFWAFALAFLLSMICIYSIGFLIAAIAPNDRAAMIVAFVVYFPMTILSGASIPLQVMPGFIQTFSKFLPLTYCVELMQGAWVGEPLGNYVVPILIMGGISAVCIGLSIKFFKWE